MNPTPTSQQLREHPAVRHYTLFCLASLLLLVVCLFERGLGWYCAIPALIGVSSLLMRWGLGPPMVLVSLTGLLVASPFRYPYQPRLQSPTWLDLLLCVAATAYALAHYRLLSLLLHIFPPDSRRARETPDPTRRRSPDQVSATELVSLGMGVVTWTILALLVWTWMSKSNETPLGMSADAWRVLRLIWAFLFVLTATAVVIAHRRMKRASPQECLLYLQDEVWRLTRREQSSLNRWLSWARLRGRKKKEKA
jgi:hypothetical protein